MQARYTASGLLGFAEALPTQRLFSRRGLGFGGSGCAVGVGGGVGVGGVGVGGVGVGVGGGTYGGGTYGGGTYGGGAGGGVGVRVGVGAGLSVGVGVGVGAGAGGGGADVRVGVGVGSGTGVVYGGGTRVVDVGGTYVPSAVQCPTAGGLPCEHCGSLSRSLAYPVSSTGVGSGPGVTGYSGPGVGVGLGDGGVSSPFTSRPAWSNSHPARRPLVWSISLHPCTVPGMRGPKNGPRCLKAGSRMK